MQKLYPEYPGPPLLKYLSPAEQQKLLAQTEAYRFSAEENVIYHSDSDHVMYLIEEGSVEVSALKEGHRTTLATLYAGDVLGEVAFLSGAPRTADVIALEDCTIRILEQERLLPLLEQDPTISAHLFLALSEILCERFSSTLKKISQQKAINWEQECLDWEW